MIIKTIREYIERLENSEETELEYINAIADNNADMCKAYNINKIIVGHMHKKMRYNINLNDIWAVNTYQTTKEALELFTNNGKKIFVIADAHITHKSDVNYIQSIIDIIDSKDYDKLIFLGDSFDLWIRSGKRIFTFNKIIELVDRIKSTDDIIFIRGNHDYDISNYTDIGDVKDYIIIDNFYFTHGHQYDPIFNANIFSKIFWTAQLYIGDNIYKLNGWLNKVFRGE